MKDEIMAANTVETTEGIANPNTESASTETTTAETLQPTETAKPDVTTTQVFSQRLKEQTQKAVDAEYDRLYGTEYGIHSKAEYDKRISEQEAEAQRQQFQEQNGFDPSVIDERVQQAIENHPAVKAAKEQSSKMTLDNAAMELASVAKSIGIEQEIKSWADVESLPKYEEIKANIMKGNDVIGAAKLAYFDVVVGKAAQTAQQETIKKIAANGESSPGSLAAGGEGEAKSIYSMAKTDFAKLQEEVLRGERKKI